MGVGGFFEKLPAHFFDLSSGAKDRHGRMRENRCLDRTTWLIGRGGCEDANKIQAGRIQFHRKLFGDLTNRCGFGRLPDIWLTAREHEVQSLAFSNRQHSALGITQDHSADPNCPACVPTSHGPRYYRGHGSDLSV